MKAMRTIVTALAVAALLAAGSGLFACKKKEPETIKIGVILPLTGDGASLGKDAERGIRLALVQAEKDGLFEPGVIQFIVEDSKGEAKTGVSAYRKLVDQDGVRLIIGDLFSAPTLAIAPFAERDKVLLFSPGASNPKITTAGDYVFRNYPSDNFEGKLTAKYFASERGIKKVAVVYVNNDYGEGLKEVFSNEYPKRGGTISIIEGYVEGVTDFKTIITKIKIADVEAVYLPGYYAEIGSFVKQAKELGLDKLYFSNVGVEDPKVFEIAGTAINGLMYTAPAVDLTSSNPVVVEFKKTYVKEYGVEPGFPAAHAYDTAMVILNCLAKEGSDPDTIKSYLYDLRDYNGVTGSITFDKNGDVVKDFFIKQIRDRKFVIVQRIRLP